MPRESDPIPDLVGLLISPDRQIRESAARELYRRGRALADAAISSWRKAPEIAALITGHCTVGIALAPEHFAKLRTALGNPRLAEVPPDQDAKEFGWSLDASTHLDILTTRDLAGSGAIARFLAKSGEGIQQVEFVTRDVDRETELLRSRMGVQPIHQQTRNGADGTRVNFFLVATPSGGKVLIELVENPERV